MHEGEFTRKFIKHLNRDSRYYVIKLHGGIFQQRGLPDLLLLFNGKAIFIEIKMNYNTLSSYQRLMIKTFTRIKCQTYIVRYIENTKKYILYNNKENVLGETKNIISFIKLINSYIKMKTIPPPLDEDPKLS